MIKIGHIADIHLGRTFSDYGNQSGKFIRNEIFEAFKKAIALTQKEIDILCDEEYLNIKKPILLNYEFKEKNNKIKPALAAVS